MQLQAVLALRAAASDAVERCAVVCLRHIDTAGLHTCRAASSECPYNHAPLIQFFDPRALQCTLRSVCFAPSRAETKAVVKLAARCTATSMRMCATGLPCPAYCAGEWWRCARCRCHLPPIPNRYLLVFWHLLTFLQEHARDLCLEREVSCIFPCCKATFPLSSRVGP